MFFSKRSYRTQDVEALKAVLAYASEANRIKATIDGRREMNRGIDWEKIRGLIENGVPYKQVSEEFKVRNDLIRKRSSVERWNTPKRVEERIKELKAERDAKSAISEENGGKNGEKSQITPKNGVNSLDLIANTWLDRAEEHRLTAYRIAKKGLKVALEKDIPVIDWSDIEKIDKIGRRSTGLDGSDGSVSVNIGLQLVNQRILQEDLPLDAVEID